MSTTLGSIAAYSSQSFFNFTKVDCNDNDTVTLPEQYTWNIVSKWGDPMWSDVEEFDQTSCGSHESQLKSVGDNNDGMELFVTSDNKTLLAVNNEYTKEHMEIYYVGNEAANSKKFKSLRKQNFELWKGVQSEDLNIIEGMQDGRKSPSYNGGNFSPVMDNPTHHFHKWVANNIMK